MPSRQSLRCQRTDTRTRAFTDTHRDAPPAAPSSGTHLREMISRVTQSSACTHKWTLYPPPPLLVLNGPLGFPAIRLLSQFKLYLVQAEAILGPVLPLSCLYLHRLACPSVLCLA